MLEKDRKQRLKIARTVDQFQNGKLTRSEFIQKCAQAGFAFSSLGFLNSATIGCRPDKDELGPNSAIDSLTEQHKFLKDVGRTFAGKTIRIVTEATPPSRAIRSLMQDEFIKLTGIQVEWELLPLEKVLARVAQDTARSVATSDIYYWDQAWIGRFVDDGVDPLELLAKKDIAYPGYDFDDILKPLVENIATYKGKLAAIPYDIPIFMLAYRRDIFEKLALTPPKTVPEYLEISKIIAKEMAPQVYGSTAQWKTGHYALECDMTAWLWAHGGSIFGHNEEPTIDDERALAAMEYMLELGKTMPPEVSQYDWNGEAESFRNGRAAMYFSWGQYFPSFDDPEQSSIVGLAEPAKSPKEIALRKKSECGFDETPGINHQGGSSLAISRYSQNIDAAWIFLQWATSSDITTRASLIGGGASPIRKSNYEDPRVKKNAKVMAGTTRYFDMTLDCINDRMGTEPHLPAWATLSVESFAVELGKMIVGIQNPKTTLKNMARDARKAVKES